MQTDILKINNLNQNLYSPFRVEIEMIGEIVPKFDGLVWKYSERMYDTRVIEEYVSDESNINDYIESPDYALFFMIYKSTCIGMIKLFSKWNQYGFIEDLVLLPEFRGKGLTKELIDASIKWSKSKGLKGISLETSSDNLVAVKTYIKNGFEIGGIDSKIYSKVGNNALTIYMYLDFEK